MYSAMLQVMSVFLSEFPHFEEKVDMVMGASPLTNNFYIGSTSGEVHTILIYFTLYYSYHIH